MKEGKKRHASVTEAVASLPQTPTCLEDLVADGEAGPVRLIVGHELDEQLAAAGDDGGRRDLPAELPQHGGVLAAAVVHLHVVVPAAEARRG